MKEVICGIYSIKSKLNGKVYIGSSVDIYRRWEKHRAQLRTNKHHSQHLQNHFNKYGEQDLVFNVLEVVHQINKDLKTDLELCEQKHLDATPNKFNILTVAYSSVGIIKKNAKNYSYDGNKYNVRLYVKGIDIRRSFITEPEAIQFVKEVKDYGLMKYYNENYILKIKENYIRQYKGYYYLHFTFKNVEKRFISKRFASISDAEDFLYKALNYNFIDVFLEQSKKVLDLKTENSAGYKYLYYTEQKRWRVNAKYIKSKTFILLEDAINYRNQELIKLGFTLKE